MSLEQALLSLLLTLPFCFQELHLLPEAVEELVLTPLVRGVSSFGATFSGSLNSFLESSTLVATSDVTSCFTSLAEIPAGARNAKPTATDTTPILNFFMPKRIIR